MAIAKKINSGNHLPGTGDDRFPVYSKQFNELVDAVLEIEGTDGTLSADVISEATTATGVTVDGVLLKDSEITTGANGISTSVANTYYPMPVAAAQDDIAAGTGGAISVANYYTTINTDAGGDAFTLADGTVKGQIKKIQLIVDGGGDAVITPANLSGGTIITMADAGDFAVLLFNGTDWVALELGNAVDGVSAPVLS